MTILASIYVLFAIGFGLNWGYDTLLWAKRQPIPQHGLPHLASVLVFVITTLTMPIFLGIYTSAALFPRMDTHDD